MRSNVYPSPQQTKIEKIINNVVVVVAAAAALN